MKCLYERVSRAQFGVASPAAHDADCYTKANGCLLTSCPEHVSSRELPHARHELRQATAEDSHADDDVGLGNMPNLSVVDGQHESCRREGEETSV